MPDGAMGGIPTQLVIPPGTSEEDRRAIEAAQVWRLGCLWKVGLGRVQMSGCLLWGVGTGSREAWPSHVDGCRALDVAQEPLDCNSNYGQGFGGISCWHHFRSCDSPAVWEMVFWLSSLALLPVQITLASERSV